MADQELKYKITTEGNTKGAEDVARSVEKTGQAAKAAAPAVAAVGKGSQEMARGLGEGAAIGNSAVSAITNLQTASQGGAAGLLAVARAAFATGVSFKGLLASLGPFGIAAAAIAIALGLMSTALRSSETAAADAKVKIDELNKAKLDNAVEEQGKLKAAAAETLATVQAEARALEEIADYELAKRKAAVRADAKGAGEDPAITERKLVELDRQRDDEKRTNALKLANDEASERWKAQKALEASATKAAQEVADAEARRALLAARERALNATPETSNVSGMSTSNPEYARAKDARDEARAAAKGDTDTRIEDLKRLAKEAKVDAEKAAVTTAQAQAAAKLLADTKAVVDPKIAATRKDEDRIKREETAAEKAATDKAREKQDAEIRKLPASIWNNRIASGDTSVDADAVKRNYPGYKFTERPKSDTPEAPMTPTESVADLAAKTAADAAAKSAAAKPTGGTMIGPDGQVINTAARQPTGPSMIGPDGRPVAVQSGQPTGPGRRAYREGDSDLKGAADKVADAAGKSESAVAATQEQLAKIGEGSSKIAQNSADLSTQISTASTGIATANESLATAITGATSDLNTMMEQAVTLGGQNVQAYVELTGMVRDLAKQVRTFQAQLAAARSRK